MNEFMGIPALYAEGAQTDRMFPVGIGPDNGAILDLQNQAAAGSTIGADGFYKLRSHVLCPKS
jgi:hypothetical protein